MPHAWRQQAQRAAAGGVSDEALCGLVAKLDQRLSESCSSAEEYGEYQGLDAFLLQQMLSAASSLRLQILSCQALAKLADFALGTADVGSLVDYERLWKRALESDAITIRLLPIAASCQDNALLKDTINPQLVRWVSTRGFESCLQMAALLALTTITARHPDVITEEQVLIICCQLAEWLKGAGVVQGSRPGKRWKDAAARVTAATPAAVKESDGSPTTAEFFTVLNIGHYYTEAQVLNLHAYSVLRTWLTSVKVTDIKYVLPLLDAVLEYCGRTLLQAEKTATKDADLVLSVLVESVSLLDVVAGLSDAHRSRCISKVKAVDLRDMSNPHALMSVLQFFLNHAKESAAPVIAKLFGAALSDHYVDSSFNYELIIFVKKNLSCLCYDTTCLKVYFPNLFKVLAWNPPCYLDDFVTILPAAMCRQTALELIHFLLDLPCLSAALSSAAALATVQQMPQGPRGDVGGGSVPVGNVETYTDCKPWLTYLLRSQSGGGDTIGRLQVLHSALAPMADHPRVISCAQASLIFVREFFHHFLTHCEADEASHMLQVILERVSLLFGPSQFQKPMQRLLCDEIVRLLDKYPHLLAAHKSDVLAWLVSTKVASANTLISIHLAWSVGHYCSPEYGEKYTPGLMTQYYETMECLVYEMISDTTLPGTAAATPALFGEESVQLLLTVITAMTKLACRCQDLVPRVLLCIAKVTKRLDVMPPAAQLSSSSQDQQALWRRNCETALRGRLQELVNLINISDMASTVLNMHSPSKLSRMHLDNTAMPALLETISSFI